LAVAVTGRVGRHALEAYELIEFADDGCFVTAAVVLDLRIQVRAAGLQRHEENRSAEDGRAEKRIHVRSRTADGDAHLNPRIAGRRAASCLKMGDE
jgi:hypothetical protein